MRDASEAAIAWVERLTWILMYGGLFAFVLGWATLASDPVVGTWLMVAGGVAAAGGVALVWVRSRMRPRS